MFLESSSFNGSIEVICGCMFSGKTEELIRRIKRARIAGLETILFKLVIDIRYHKEKIVSHNANSIDSYTVSNSKEILNKIEGQSVIGIDEAQFFDEDVVELCKYLASQNKRVIVAGLDMDFLGRPFGPMPYLLSISEFVTKLHAICKHCGNTATHSYRKTRSNLTVEIGETDIYEARCRKCFEKGQDLKEEQIGLF